MTDDPEDVISESTTVKFTRHGGTHDIAFPLSQYSDEELLDLATELVERKPSPIDGTVIVWQMAFVGLEMNRRVFEEILIDSE